MNTRVSRCALVALMLLVAASATAQQGTTEIRGKVTDSQGAILPGVNVTVRNQDTGMFRETVSSSRRTYFISANHPWEIRALRRTSGVQEVCTLLDVLLEVGKTAVTRDVQLVRRRH